MLNVYNTTLVSSWQAVDCLAVPRAQEHTLTTTQNPKTFLGVQNQDFIFRPVNK